MAQQVQGGSGWGSSRRGRPRLCPSCGVLVGANVTRCHECGASLTFSLAAASRSLSKLLPQTSPATYAILSISCALYAISALATLRLGGGMGGSIWDIGAVNGSILIRLGASLPPVYDLQQPWRLVMAIFLHGSLLHIGMNMWVLMYVGPQIEELYGSARYLFTYVLTGIAGFLLSSFTGHFSVGGSASLLGLIGIMLAITTRRGGAMMKMLRGQLIVWVVIIFIFGGVAGQVDNAAHLGGLIAGFVLGRIMADREPQTPAERKRAHVLGWGAAAVMMASFAVMLMGYFRG